MKLPTVSVLDFTEGRPADSLGRGRLDGPPHPLSLAQKHWETMQTTFDEPSSRSRNMYFGASSLMRAVTELRQLTRHGRQSTLETRLRSLQSDCTAMTMALPPWVTSPVRSFDTGETTEEHRCRLETLLVLHWYVHEHARLLGLHIT